MKKNFALVALSALVCAVMTFTGCLPDPIPVVSVTLNVDALTLEVGEKKQLTVVVAPLNADDRTVSSKSSDPAVATIDEGGIVTAVAPGMAIITVSANDGSGKSDTCAVTVNAPEPPEPEVTITSSLPFGQVKEILYSEAVDEEGKPAMSLKVEVAADERISTIGLKLTTENEMINGVLTGMQLANGFELGALPLGALDEFFGGGIPTGEDVVGKETVTLDFSALLALITTIPGGVEQFDIDITATDGDGRAADPKTLKLKFTDNVTVWASISGEGFDIAEPVEILASEATEADVKLDVAMLMENPIDSFLVEIDSSSEAFMAALDLLSLDVEFDLANPDAATAGALAALATQGITLPSGEAVKGQSELPFDLSTFIPMILGVGGECEVTFKLTVADANGHGTTQTLILNFVDDTPDEGGEEGGE